MAHSDIQVGSERVGGGVQALCGEPAESDNADTREAPLVMVTRSRRSATQSMPYVEAGLS